MIRKNPLQSGIMVIFRLLDDNPRLVSHMESPSEKEIGVDRKLLAQARSLLGAIHTCRYDQWFTLVNVRWELANMLGYTVREINEKFHDRLTEMMYPADVEKVRRQISRQLKRGRVSEAEFRWFKKAGKFLWGFKQRPFDPGGWRGHVSSVYAGGYYTFQKKTGRTSKKCRAAPDHFGSVQ